MTCVDGDSKNTWWDCVREDVKYLTCMYRQDAQGIGPAEIENRGKGGPANRGLLGLVAQWLGR